MLNKIISLTAAAFIFLNLAINPAPAFAQSETGQNCPQSMRYIFSWSLEQSCGFAVRGGTTKGAQLTLDPAPHSGWLSLQEAGLSKKEKDRRAILAMAGPYRTSFEFLETVGYTEDFSRAAPYQSWGTEYIYVVEASEDFISLQHIMVMFVAMDDGEIIGPLVQKHWRQDWQFEKAEIFAFSGDRTWTYQSLSAEQVTGTWAQSVFQVDDSPRYESYGSWEHNDSFSSWISEDTWRPIPRRESSVRDDYDVLIGRNRHTIIPSGWVHEEENYKVDLNNGKEHYLAKELGVNRYDRIIDFDFSAGDEYWQSTAPFWQDVRSVWSELIASAQSHQILESYEGVPLFAELFEQADLYAGQENYDSAAVQETVRNILNNYFL